MAITGSVGSVNISVNYVVNNNTTRAVNNSINRLQNRAPQLQTAFTSAFGKVGAAITAAFSVKAIVDFSKKALELASNLQEVQNVVDVTFEHMNETINKFAKAAIVNLGMSETSAKKYAGTFGAMAKSFGFTTEEATNMAMAITSLTGDVASFYNLNHDLAYTKLKSIFTGETETLKDLGVVMTQTALNQYAMANGYGKTVQQMTEQEKVMLRYNFVMEKLGLAQGDFVRTQNGWANQTRILSERWKAIMASIGDGLIILLTPAIQALNTFLSHLQVAADKFAGFVALLTGKKVETSNQAKAQAQIAAIGATATSSEEDLEGLADGYTAAGKAAKKASESLASFDNVVQLADTSSSSGSGSGSGGVSAGSSVPEYTFTEAEVAQTTIIDGLASKMDMLKEKFGNIFDFSIIKSNFERIGQELAGIFNNTQFSADNFFSSFIGSLQIAGVSLLETGKSVIEALTGGMALWLEQGKERISVQWNAIYTNFANGFSNIGILLDSASSALSQFFSLEDTQQSIANAMTLLEGTVSSTFQLVASLFAEITEFITETINDNFTGLQGLMSSLASLLESVTTLIKNLVLDCFQSVQSTFDKYIRPTLDNIQEGFSQVFGSILEVWNTAIGPLLKIVGDSFNNLWSNHLSPFVDEVLGMVGAFVEMVSVVWNKVLAPFVSMVVEDCLPPIMGAISFLWGAVEGLVQNVIDIFSGLAQTLKGIFELITGLMTVDFQKGADGMKNIAYGLVNAIANVFSSIVNVIIGALNGIIRAANKIKMPGTDFGVNIPEIPEIKRLTPKLKDGGIAYKQTDFGNYIAGEAGAEAIIPLENSEYTKVLAREIVKGMVDAGMAGGDTYQISTAYLDRRGLERLTQEINGVNKQIGARKGVVAYG